MRILKKDPQRDYVILNFTDPQLGNRVWNEGDSKGELLVLTVKTLAERVKPDLITVSGDLAIAGEYEAYDKLADLLDGCGVPWACVWGNHDHQDGLEPLEKVEEAYAKRPLCLYERGNPDLGRGNYLLVIEEDERPIHGLIMMDSHNRDELFDEEGKRINKYARLSDDQLDWYDEQCEYLISLGCKESTLMLHIPIHAYKEAWAAAFNAERHPTDVWITESGDPKFWNKGYEGSFGIKHKGINCYYRDDGVFDRILRHGSTKTVICGHDHINSFVIKHRGVTFAYGLKTGAGNSWNAAMSGGTVIRLNADGVQEIRHEFVPLPEGMIITRGKKKDDNAQKTVQ